MTASDFAEIIVGVSPNSGKYNVVKMESHQGFSRISQKKSFATHLLIPVFFKGTQYISILILPQTMLHAFQNAQFGVPVDNSRCQ